MTQINPTPTPPPTPHIPARPLEYGHVAYQSRPGLITAIGVMSIVVACLSFLASGIGSLYGFGLVMYATVLSNLNTPAVTTPTGPVAADAEILGPTGLMARDREPIVTRLQFNGALQPAQRWQVDELLAEHGKTLFPDLQNLAITSGRQITRADGVPVIAFDLPTGLLEIGDDFATFTPLEGPLLAVRATDALSAEQVKQLVDYARTMSPPMTDLQAAALQAALAAPDQQIVLPHRNVLQLLSQFNYVMANPDGSLFIYTIAGSIHIDSAGVLTSNIDPVMLRSSVTVSTTPNIPDISLAAAVLLLAASLASLGLAIYLFVIAILTLRLSMRGRTLHRIYAWIKLPQAVLSGVAVFWVYHSISRSIAATLGRGASEFDTAMILTGIGVVLVGVLYPIIVLGMLSSRTAREYYGGVSTAG